jgi:2-C-methyl-D-erythritol 4-phosphate cytidylyltransferase/2-C-methyl-D-erythritol 4-phosphate cytidylyltransferase/2-C-methyl-D-erythritol 2,4-cyclodiphosphate synthase
MMTEMIQNLLIQWKPKKILTKTIQTLNNPKIAVIITAAGSSTRMGGTVKKEFLPLNNGTVLSSCASAFLNALSKKYQITDFVITCRAGSENDARAAVSSLNYAGFNFVTGGASRQESVFKGLLAVEASGSNPDIVMIHDGARPFVSEKIILEGVETALEYGASVPGITPTDTQKEIDESGMIVRHLVRSRLAAVQTPQNFDFEKLLEAHKKAAQQVKQMAAGGIKKEFTDDTEIWGEFCGKVRVYEGDDKNIKITWPKDLTAYLKDR